MKSPADIQSLCQQAIGFHQRGQIAEAERLVDQILSRDRGNPIAQNILALIRSGQGRHSDAIALLDRVLKANPKSTAALGNKGLVLQAAGRHGEALAIYDWMLRQTPHPVLFVNRGNALSQLRRHDEALASYGRAIALDPNYAEGFYNRGLTLLEVGKANEALADFDRTLALRPQLSAALNNRGNALLRLDRFEEAISVFDKLLAGEPRNALAWCNRGAALASLNRTQEAIESYDRAIAVDAAFSPAHVNRANALRTLGRNDEAKAGYDRAATANPNDATAYYGRGAMAADAGRSDSAIRDYEKAIAAQPNHVDAAYGLGFLLTAENRLNEALGYYDVALKHRPGYAEAWNNRGVVLNRLNRFEAAIQSYTKAIDLKPDYAEAWFNRAHATWTDRRDYTGAVRDLDRVLATNPHFEFARGDRLHLKMQVADWQEFETEKVALDAGVRGGEAIVRPFDYQGLSDSQADLKSCAQRFAARFPELGIYTSHKPGDHEKIRVGYVSADFREQATAYLMAGVYETHDKSRFEILAYDNGGSDRGPTRARIDAAFDRITDIRDMSDHQAAHRIASDQVDILVNLSGYFGNPRMGVFARRPAPVQVNYLGFPGTLAAPYIDYIVADRIVIPEAEQGFYTEKVAYLPDSYQANDSKRTIGAATDRAANGLPLDAVVFCNFNHSYKLLPHTFDLWVQILKSVEGSVLWLLEANPPFADNVRSAARERGIAADRIIFAPFAPVAQHLGRLACADIFLDSLPYNAHTTASDSLWAGVPLLTCVGTTFPGRVAASLLYAVGLPELVTRTEKEFVETAVALGNDRERREGLRAALASAHARCALFDTKRYCRNLEQLYVEMVNLWSRGEGPRPLSLTSSA